MYIYIYTYIYIYIYMYTHRRQLMRGLTTEVIRHGRIRTTYARAKALGSFIDRTSQDYTIL